MQNVASGYAVFSWWKSSASVSLGCGINMEWGREEYRPLPIRDSFPFLVSCPRYHSNVAREESMDLGVAESNSTIEKDGCEDAYSNM